MKKITVVPYLLEGYPIIAFSDAWMRLFDNLTFDVAIVNKRLQITSNQTIQK